MPRFFHSKINLNDNLTTDSQGNQHPYSQTQSPSIVVNNPNDEQNGNARKVRIRLVFIRIGEIDTLNEKYQAEIYFEARWNEKIALNTLNLTVQQQSRVLQDNQKIKINDFNSTLYWTPQLFIENAIGQIGEQEKWFSVRRISDDSHSSSVFDMEICEHRRLKGVFWEKLELNHFPVDVQDLTVSITSHHHTDECVLVQDERIQSSINREAFFDQQEWKLYEHVATQERCTKEEYSFDIRNSEQVSKMHPVLAITCRAARRPGYFYWNGFFMIFLITVCSFCIFSIPPDLPQSRIQITCTLLLTSVTFRWVVNRSLPTVSYLTTLDQYAIISIVILVVLCVWHSIIATVTLFNPAEIQKGIYATNLYVQIDRYVFVVMFFIYILIHLSLLIWLIYVPYKRRRQMEHFDEEYSNQKHSQAINTRDCFDHGFFPIQELSFKRTPSIQSVVSTVMTPKRTVIYSNSSAFLPIDEKPKKSLKMSENSDDVFDQPKK